MRHAPHFLLSFLTSESESESDRATQAGCVSVRGHGHRRPRHLRGLRHGCVNDRVNESVRGKHLVQQVLPSLEGEFGGGSHNPHHSQD